MAADEKACDAGDFESCDNLGIAYIGIKIEGVRPEQKLRKGIRC